MKTWRMRTMMMTRSMRRRRIWGRRSMRRVMKMTLLSRCMMCLAVMRRKTASMKTMTRKKRRLRMMARRLSLRVVGGLPWRWGALVEMRLMGTSKVKAKMRTRMARLERKMRRDWRIIGFMGRVTMMMTPMMRMKTLNILFSQLLRPKPWLSEIRGTLMSLTLMMSMKTEMRSMMMMMKVVQTSPRPRRASSGRGVMTHQGAAAMMRMMMSRTRGPSNTIDPAANVYGSPSLIPSSQLERSKQEQQNRNGGFSPVFLSRFSCKDFDELGELHPPFQTADFRREMEL